ncbi:MAG: hypothetical protein AAF496_15965 [Pseudomonadota bacterium]
MSVLALSACTTKPLESSVPTQAGHNLHSARVAVQNCATEADIGADAAVIGGYATNILFFGIILGPAITSAFDDQLRAQGAIDQVDRCMTERGFERRDLTGGEQFWLNNATGGERVRRLDHLVDGGTIETYRGPQV